VPAIGFMAPIAMNSAASNQLAAMTIGQHKRSGHGAPPSLSDVGAAGATAAKAKSSSGKIGNLLDMKA
jgi:hypothetical protein